MMEDFDYLDCIEIVGQDVDYYPTKKYSTAPTATGRALYVSPTGLVTVLMENGGEFTVPIEFLVW